MLRLAKLATPLTAGPVVVPASVPPLGLVPSATVTLPANAVARLPPASRAATCTAGLIVGAAAAVLGWTVKPSWFAVPRVMLKAALVALLRPPAGAVAVRV